MTPDEIQTLVAPLVHWISIPLTAILAAVVAFVAGRLWERRNLDDQAEQLREHWIGVIRVRENLLPELWESNKEEES